MAEQSKIEWTNATWNPITGCTLVDEGCRNCYAADLASTRLKNHPSRKGLARRNGQGVAKFTGEVRLNEGWLDQPLRWKKPRMIFVCAHSDLFHENVPDKWIDEIFEVMDFCPQHIFQVLTKRPERAWKYIYERQIDEDSGQMDNMTLLFPNVWLDTSASDQESANERIPHLLKAPIATRFLSAEPLLGPIDLSHFGKLDWVICGGESGRNARPMHHRWPKMLHDHCAATGTPFFFKQWGEYAPQIVHSGKVLSVGATESTRIEMVKVGKAKRAACWVGKNIASFRPTLE